MEPFFVRPLAWPARERRAQRLAAAIKRQPDKIERRWAIADLVANGCSVDITQRVEYLAGLLPRQRGGRI